MAFPIHTSSPLHSVLGVQSPSVDVDDVLSPMMQEAIALAGDTSDRVFPNPNAPGQWYVKTPRFLALTDDEAWAHAMAGLCISFPVSTVHALRLMLRSLSPSSPRVWTSSVAYDAVVAPASALATIADDYGHVFAELVHTSDAVRPTSGNPPPTRPPTQMWGRFRRDRVTLERCDGDDETALVDATVPAYMSAEVGRALQDEGLTAAEPSTDDVGRRARRAVCAAHGAVALCSIRNEDDEVVRGVLVPAPVVATPPCGRVVPLDVDDDATTSRWKVAAAGDVLFVDTNDARWAHLAARVAACGAFSDAAALAQFLDALHPMPASRAASVDDPLARADHARLNDASSKKISFRKRVAHMHQCIEERDSLAAEVSRLSRAKRQRA